jgi:hypothetical protein
MQNPSRAICYRFVTQITYQNDTACA